MAVLTRSRQWAPGAPGPATAVTYHAKAHFIPMFSLKVASLPYHSRMLPFYSHTCEAERGSRNHTPTVSWLMTLFGLFVFVFILVPSPFYSTVSMAQYPVPTPSQMYCKCPMAQRPSMSKGMSMMSDGIRRFQVHSSRPFLRPAPSSLSL